MSVAPEATASLAEPVPGEPARPSAVIWTAAALVLLTAVVLSLIRVQAQNLPWHLATGRLALENGHWLARNTFSYTFPDYPLYQQYPVFQTVVWGVYRVAGWNGLSVLTAVGWTSVLLLFVHFAGRIREGAHFHLLWMIALFALQRRMVLRPDLFTMLAFGAELLALDAFSRGRDRALLAVPLIHLGWVNSHQLFPVSLLVQGLFLIDLLRRRDRRRATLAALALVAALALTFATPLGWRIVLTPMRTAQTMAVYRGQVAELRPIWRMPYELTLALSVGLPTAWALGRARRLASVFDVGLWLLSLALVISAVRGLMFFAIVSAAVFQRATIRLHAAGGTLLPGIGPGPRRILGVVALTLTGLLAYAALKARVIHPSWALAGTQPGLGRAIGGWAETATEFLRRYPPPGRMLNVGADLGDDVIFWLPGTPVFVDSRLETYPPEFLREALAIENDDAALGRVLDRYGVQWVFALHTRPALRDRALGLLRAGWQPVYVDSAELVLVRSTSATEAYRRAHAIDLDRAAPADLVAAPADLRREQQKDFDALITAWRASGLGVRH